LRLGPDRTVHAIPGHERHSSLGLAFRRHGKEGGMPGSQRGDPADPWQVLKRNLEAVPHRPRRPTATVTAWPEALSKGRLRHTPVGQVAHDLVQSSNAFVNGAVLSLFAIAAGLVVLLNK